MIYQPSYAKASEGTPSPKMRFRVACHPKPAGRRVAGVTGLEPAASGVTGQRSNQLSYTPVRAEIT